MRSDDLELNRRTRPVRERNTSHVDPLTRARTHLWTPREMQAVFEEDRHVVGAAICPASNDAAMELRARMGVRRPEPNHKCVLWAR